MLDFGETGRNTGDLPTEEEALDEWSTIEVTPELIELAQSVVSGPIPGFTVTLAQNAVPAQVGTCY